MGERPSLRRLRIAFALTAVGVLGLTGLLVARARAQIEEERSAREASVAERVFDEMERSLEHVVAREGQRLREGRGPSTEPFAAGTFEVDRDGNITTVPASLQELVGDWLLDDERPQPRWDEVPGSTARYARRQGSWIDPRSRGNDEELDLKVLGELNRGNRGEALTRPAGDDVSHLYLGGPYSALVRSVVDGGVRREAGVVLDSRKLEEWLRAQVLGGSSLDIQGFALDTTGVPGVRVPGGVVYRHRFAPPFELLGAQLGIEPLSPARGAGVVLWLSVALAVAVILGLVAAYRMVAVVVAYSEQRSNFVASVTHELKTPLTTIRMYGEMLRDGTISEEGPAREYHQAITEEAERLSRLIEGVLEIARMERPGRPARLSVGDVGPVVKSAVDKVRPHASAEGFELRLEVDADLPPVRFDADGVVQVVLNLVDNAVKYARAAPERVVTIGCRRRAGRVLLTVRDRGPGVPAERLGRIFEPFYRGEDELTRTSRGAGLGLALVRGLAARMGADVSCRNAEERGLEVTLTFATA